jgi:hypothetical protein
MLTESQEFSLPLGLYQPIKCKMTVFGSIEVDGQVTLVKDDMVHFVSDDKKFQILVRRECVEVTALPEHRASGRYDVLVPPSAQIKALRNGGELGQDWVDIGKLSEDGIKMGDPNA